MNEITQSPCLIICIFYPVRVVGVDGRYEMD